MRPSKLALKRPRRDEDRSEARPCAAATSSAEDASLALAQQQQQSALDGVYATLNCFPARRELSLPRSTLPEYHAPESPAARAAA